jgi:hypothetical protein
MFRQVTRRFREGISGPPVATGAEGPQCVAAADAPIGGTAKAVNEL